MEFVIENQVEDIVLQRGIRHILKGKEDGRFSATIRSGESLSMKIRASNNVIRSIECCLIYELARDGRERMTMIGNYRTFLAIEVSSTPITNTYTASAAVFMVKSRRFTGEVDDVKCLYNNILRYYRVKNDSSFKYNLAGRILKLDIAFLTDKQVIIKFALKKTNEYHEYGPVFHRVDKFA
jgi:hypothetical protein